MRARHCTLADLDHLSLEDVADQYDYLTACEEAEAELAERRAEAGRR